MKLQDFITALYKRIPALTGLFSDEISINSLTKVGSTVTAVCSTAHGLSTGNYVCIANAKRRTPISTLEYDLTKKCAVARTSAEHDLTEVWFDTVEISGCDQEEYNGFHPLLRSLNRTLFHFSMDEPDDLTATGAMYLLEPWRRGFNGWFPVTVVNSTTFTYESPESFNGTAEGAMIARKLPRIHGALTLDRAIALYTAQQSGKYSMFVVLGNVIAGKDRSSLGDSIAAHMAGTEFRQQLTNELDVFVFVPTANSLGARSERDTITTVATYLYKTLVGTTYPTYLIDRPSTVLNFVRHGVHSYYNGFYIHQFSFEAMTELTTNDVVEPEFTRAFRDADLRFHNNFDTIIQQTLVNIDDEPNA